MSSENCLWCDEPVDWPREPAQQMPVIEADGTARIALQHSECSLRLAAGSVGHQRGRCSCYGGDEEDPPGVSRRVAAKAATILFREGEAAVVAYLAGREVAKR